MGTKVGNYIVEKCFDMDTNRDFFEVYESTEDELFGEYVGAIQMKDAIANRLIDDDGEIDINKMEYYIFVEM